MQQEPFEIRQLRYFLEVADAGSFSRAAKRLGVSQPAVSQQLHDLESGVRAVLLLRRGKRTLLTPAGLLFQGHARAILRQIDQSLQELGREPGNFMAEEHPGIDLSIREISSTDIEKELEDGRMDVGLGLGWVTRHSPNLRYELLCDDQFTVVVAATHPWAKRRVVELSELHGRRLLQLPDTYVMRRMTDEMCRNYRIRPRTIAEINSIEALLRSLGPLKAAALMPRISLREAGSLDLKAIRLEGRNLGLEVGLLRLIGAGTNSAVATFTKLAKVVVPAMVGNRET